MRFTMMRCCLTGTRNRKWVWFQFLFVENGERQAVVDSTPIIRKLEATYERRSVIPEDPATAFINDLLEDFADEWLTKAMFHYRWYYADDIEKGGKNTAFVA